MEKEAKVSSTLLGHKARCFDVRLNPFDSSQLLTSSEDGHARLWDINRKTCLQALCHNKDAEVLRAAFVSPGCIVTAGSDGIVKIWKDEVQSKQGTDVRASLNNGSVKTNFVNSSSLDHGGSDFQVYVCEPYISTSSAQNAAYLLTGVENRLILWSAEDFSLIQEWTYFDSREEAFGGNHRNPDKQNFVFDAKWHPHDSTKAVIALSDGSLSFVDTRLPQEDHFIVDLHDEDVHLGHPTSIHWGCGRLCYVSYGSGSVVIVDVDKGCSLGVVQLHRSPCYGIMSLERRLASWSADGLLRLWTASVDENGELDECIVHQTLRVKDFSLLSCCSVPGTSSIVCAGSFANEKQKGNSFLGTPVYIVDTREEAEDS